MTRTNTGLSHIISTLQPGKDHISCNTSQIIKLPQPQTLISGLVRHQSGQIKLFCQLLFQRTK